MSGHDQIAAIAAEITRLTGGRITWRPPFAYTALSDDCVALLEQNPPPPPNLADILWRTIALLAAAPFASDAALAVTLAALREMPTPSLPQPESGAGI